MALGDEDDDEEASEEEDVNQPQSSTESQAKKPRKKKGGKEVDPDAPKRPLNPSFLYTQEHRQQVCRFSH